MSGSWSGSAGGSAERVARCAPLDEQHARDPATDPAHGVGRVADRTRVGAALPGDQDDRVAGACRRLRAGRALGPGALEHDRRGGVQLGQQRGEAW